jgi:hypothetical protein
MNPTLIAAAIDLGIQLINLAIKSADAWKQSGELDAAAEAQLDAKIANLNQQPWWKPERQ